MNIRLWGACILSITICSLMAIYKEPVTTRQGYFFTIKIPSTQVAGIDWFLGNDNELKEYVKLIKSEFVSSSSLNNDRSGKKILTFKALKPGKVTLKLVKRKSWEENKPISRKRIKLIIKESDFGKWQGK